MFPYYNMMSDSIMISRKARIRHQLKTKVCLLGEPSVGKTSLIRRYVLDQFEDTYISTIGTKVTKKDIYLPRDDPSILLTMMIWDIMGDIDAAKDTLKDYRKFRIPRSYFRGVNLGIFVCDLTR